MEIPKELDKANDLHKLKSLIPLTVRARNSMFKASFAIKALSEALEDIFGTDDKTAIK